MGELQTVRGRVGGGLWGIEPNRALSKEMRGGRASSGGSTEPAILTAPSLTNPASLLRASTRWCPAHSVPGGVTRGTDFFSGHHWTVAPREILDSTDTYRASLDR